MMRRYSILLYIILLTSFAALSQEEKPARDLTKYIPEIHATVRGRWQGEWTHNPGEGTSFGQRFQVCNARLSLSGIIAPIVDYQLQADLCDQGKMKMLDAWARVKLGDFQVTGGQSLIPFSPEAGRSPHLLMFSERGMVSWGVPVARGVGAKVGYSPHKLPISVEVAAFNPYNIGDHTPWHKDMAYAARLKWSRAGAEAQVAYENTEHDESRCHMVDAAGGWSHGRWVLYGEYLFARHDDGSADVNAYMAQGSWWMPVKWGVFNRLSFQGRYDGIVRGEKQNSLLNDFYGQDDEEDITLTHRATVGATISYKHPRVICDFKINYAHTWHNYGCSHPAYMSDMIIAELVVRF